MRTDDMTNSSMAIDNAQASKSDDTDAEPNLRHLLDQHNWFTLSNEGLVRCPLLVKGRLINPPTLSLDEITQAFAPLDKRRGSADAYQNYVALGDAQVLRHPEIDRHAMLATGRWIYTVMPRIDAKELIERDIDALANELYSIPHDSVLDWLTRIGSNRARDRHRRSSARP